MDKKDVEETKDIRDTRIGGKDGIPAGRPKGAKNKSTLLREALRGDFDELLRKDFKKIIRVVADQALEGCRSSQKLILERVVPSVHAESDNKDKHKFSGGITITIGSLENQKVDISSGDVMDGEFSEVVEDSSEQ
jgi:hypothetical protein